MKIVRLLIIAMLTAFIGAAPLYAEDEVFDQPHVYKYPEIEPAYELWGGYSIVDADGSRRAGEFIYFKDSPAMGGTVTAFPFPHRFHWELDVMNSKDYFSDLRYSYKDIVLVRSVNRALFHNLNDITLVQLDGFAPINDPTGDDYGYEAAFGNISVRLKTPNFPAHAFVNTWYMSKDGDRQQRRMGGAAYFNNRPRVTERREEDWTTTDITVGLNSHLGPIEAQYSHNEMRFKASDPVKSDAFLASTSVPARAAGTYPHSIMSRLESSVDTFKIHSSYTGRLVTTATFMVGEDNNNVSAANTDHYLLAGEVVWTPVAKFSGALRYRHEERDVVNPDSLPAGFLGFADFTAKNNIRNTISTDTTTLTAMARYRPTKKITVGADIILRHWERDHAAEWDMEPETDETALDVLANIKVLKNLKLRLRYHYMEFDDPAYNNQPDNSHRADFTVTWSPITKVVLFTSYSVAREERDHLHTLAATPLINVGGDREVSRDTVTGSVVYIARENLSLTGSYAYWRNEIEQDIAYGNVAVPTVPLIDDNSVYKDSTSYYSVAADYSPIEQLDLHAGLSYTTSKAGFNTNVFEALNPVSLASFSRLKIKETAYEFRAKYKVEKNLDVCFRFEYRDFDDRLDNPDNPELRDGTAQIYFVTVNKRW